MDMNEVKLYVVAPSARVRTLYDCILSAVGDMIP